MNIIMSLLIVLQIPDSLVERNIPGYYRMYSHFVPDSVIVLDTIRRQQIHYSQPQTLHIPDFLVNDDNYSGSGAYQYFSDAAADGQGNFWVVWCDGRNGDDDVYLSRYDAQGNPIGPNIRVNDDRGLNLQRWPAVSVNSNEAIVAWFESWDTYGSDYSPGDIFYQKFDVSGNKLGSNVQVNEIINNASGDYSHSVDVAINASGHFIITWVDHRPSGSTNHGDDVYMQLFDENGIPVGANIRVNDDLTQLPQT